MRTLAALLRWAGGRLANGAEALERWAAEPLPGPTRGAEALIEQTRDRVLARYY